MEVTFLIEGWRIKNTMTLTIDTDCVPQQKLFLFFKELQHRLFDDFEMWEVFGAEVQHNEENDIFELFVWGDNGSCRFSEVSNVTLNCKS